VQVYFAVSIEHIRASRLRALAVTTARRLEALPDIPTVGDFLPGYESSLWFGIGVPNITHPSKSSTSSTSRLMQASPIPRSRRWSPAWGHGACGAPAELGKFVANDTEKWAKVIRAANIKAD
jgi:tripartite-type tricarboxylate transporter receptor subunit TctC